VQRDFGLLSRAVAARYFEPIPFPKEGEALLSRLSKEGEVVHVMRSSGVLNFLYLAYALICRRLPPLRAAIGLRWTFWRPFRRLFRDGTAPERLSKALDAGCSALVFLRNPAGLASVAIPAEDPFPALIGRARAGKAPLFLVPELFLWRNRARSLRPGLIDLLFGSPEAPGMLVTTVAFLANYRHAFMRIGTPIDLTAFVRENPGDTDTVLARKVRGALSQHLARETRAIVGPPLKEAARVIEETLRDRTLKAALEQVAQAQGTEPSAVRRTAERYLREIAARYRPGVIALAQPVLRWVFNRIYEGIDVDEKGLERSLSAARKAPLIFCPSHKSHVDYLVLSWIFLEHGVTAPHVAAGANLSFFPLGSFLRRCGAFFLRRSFKGNAVYAATFKAYIKKLLREGVSQEFFIEGGRSRTGKLLTPKLGMVAFEVDAFLDGAQDDVYFVPVAIDYEKVVEAKEYASELAGGEKKAESIRGLLSAPKVLASRYGRIYVSFAEPISLKQFLLDRGVGAGDKGMDAKRSAVRTLAQRIVFGISRAQTVTPAALLSAALLAHRRRGTRAGELSARIHSLRELAGREGVQLSRAMEGAPSDPSTMGPVNDVARLFMEDGTLTCTVVAGEAIYSVPDDRRMGLAFYKNNLVHLVAARSLCAGAVLSERGDLSLALCRERALALSRLLKFELMFEVGKPFDALFAGALETLERDGLLLREGERVRVAPEPHARSGLAFLRDLTRDFVESYRIFAGVLPEAASSRDRKDLVRLALERGRAEFLSGRVFCAEALSRPAFENALAYFVDQGVLEEGADGKKVVLAAAHRDAAAHDALLSRIDVFLLPDP
jgi:glycerol-3-phosphate O-acyltransferase